MAKSSGFFFSMFRATITRNGVTEVIRDEHVHKELVNGKWVDVTPKLPARKSVKSKVVKKS